MVLDSSGQLHQKSSQATEIVDPGFRCSRCPPAWAPGLVYLRQFGLCWGQPSGHQPHSLARNLDFREPFQISHAQQGIFHRSVIDRGAQAAVHTASECDFVQIAPGRAHDPIGSLGAVGLEVARALHAGIDGLQLAAVSARDVDKATRNLASFGSNVRCDDGESLGTSREDGSSVCSVYSVSTHRAESDGGNRTEPMRLCAQGSVVPLR